MATRKLTDHENCLAYIVNGYVVEFFEDGIFPTLEMLRGLWNSCVWADLSDDIIEDIIKKVSKFYKTVQK